ncbi:Cyclic nucleotide-binding domain protein [Desulfitobacterium hafniense]|uniref:Cyclic nucleotide-binding domain protein n=1 Tax=Desulfitobacterium hafniense TaxID=49338 RepID=A0A098B772_DESHA|nr:Crp/Fnr family transcriptional regulator [Desulfitobacterium hafniense]CDX04192.1 Cyclic nucleotide-binding domain protein [Desulfitobacterium hafniense]
MVHNEKHDSPWVKLNPTNIGERLERYKIGIPMNYGQCETIYLQDENSNSFFYLKKGRVKAYILQKDGTEKILSIHEAGNFFGETAAIDQLPRPCCTSTMAKSEIIVLSPADLNALMKIDPDLCVNIFRAIAKKVRLLSFQVQDMAFYDAEQRVAHLLLRFANDFGTVTPEGIKLSISFTDQDLAGLVGSCRVTVTKILNTFKKEGLIEKGYRNITIKNTVRLLEYLYNHEKARHTEKKVKIV